MAIMTLGRPSAVYKDTYPMQASRTSRKKRILTAGLVLFAIAFSVFRFNDPRFFSRTYDHYRYRRRVKEIDAFLAAEVSALPHNSFRLRVGGRSEPHMLSVTVENTGQEPVRDFWMWIDGRPNFFNLRSLNDSIMAPGTAEREKVLALFAFFSSFPHYPPVDGPQSTDPITSFAVDGYGWSSTKAWHAGAMLELAGVRVRLLRLPGRRLVNEFYDPQAGRWCFVDFDLLRHLEDHDGFLLGYDQLVNRIRANPALRDDDYFRLFVRNDGTLPAPPPGGSAARFLETGLEGMDRHGQTYDETVCGYERRMRFALRPGESVLLTWEKGTKHYKGLPHSAYRGPQPAKPWRREDLLCNGRIVWRPDLDRLNAFLRQGAALSGTGVEGVRQDGGWSLALPYESPYVIVDAALEVSVHAEGVLNLAYTKRPETHRFYNMMREDVGGLLGLEPGWKPFWEHGAPYAGTVALGPLFSLEDNVASGIPHYNGRLNLSCADPAAEIEELALTTTVQVSRFGLRSLALSAGENTVNFYGEPVGAVSYRTEGGVTSATVNNDALRITLRYREGAGGSQTSSSPVDLRRLRESAKQDPEAPDPVFD